MTTKFKIPLQSEVAAYAQQKKGWPERFCIYYAERFWSHYQSNGWKVSGKAAMKDWKAAFNSQWQDLKFEADIKMLAQCRGINPAPGPDRTINFLNDRLAAYARHPTEISNESLNGLYDWMKENKVLKLNPEQVQIARNAGAEKGKGLAVKFFFENLINTNKTFSDILKPVQVGR